MVDYKKRLVEVDEILNYLSEEDYNKIPEDIKNIIQENKDREYIWKYDETKELKDQDVDRDTIVILSYLNSEYLLSAEQKELMEQIYELNEQKAKDELKERQSEIKVEDLFKNKQEENDEKEDEAKKEIVEVKKESFFRRVLNKIISICKIQI